MVIRGCKLYVNRNGMQARRVASIIERSTILLSPKPNAREDLCTRKHYVTDAAYHRFEERYLVIVYRPDVIPPRAVRYSYFFPFFKTGNISILYRWSVDRARGIPRDIPPTAISGCLSREKSRLVSTRFVLSRLVSLSLSLSIVRSKLENRFVF